MSSPTFATHKLIDGIWAPKGAPSATTSRVHIGSTQVTRTSTGGITIRSADCGQPQQTPAASPTIGFQLTPATPSASPNKGARCLVNKQAYLAAIRNAAGIILQRGTNDPEVAQMIGRGRLGSRKDTLGALHTLLARYEGAAL